MDPQREQERRTYFLCRLGFGLLAFALIVACVTAFVSMPLSFLPRRAFQGLFQSALWQWSDTPIVWGSLIGVYFLWGRWSDPSWQRRAGLLILMCIADVVLWFLDHGEAMGLRLGDFGHDWLRVHVGQAMGWAEFALIASLGCEVLVHLGVTRAVETGRATRSLVGTGALLWMLLFMQSTNWHVWPLEAAPRRRLEFVLLFLGWNMIWMIVLVQVTAITIAAAKRCSAVLLEMDLQDQDHDLLRLPSEQGWFDGSAAGRTLDAAYHAPKKPYEMHDEF